MFLILSFECMLCVLIRIASSMRFKNTLNIPLFHRKSIKKNTQKTKTKKNKQTKNNTWTLFICLLIWRYDKLSMPCHEYIFIVPKVFEALQFDFIRTTKVRITCIFVQPDPGSHGCPLTECLDIHHENMPNNVDPLNPFYMVKLGFTGVYIILLFLLKTKNVGTR